MGAGNAGARQNADAIGDDAKPRMRKFLSERERQRDPFEKCTQTRDAHPALLSITIPYPKLVGLRIHIKRITYIQRFPRTQESDCVTSLLTGLKDLER